MTSLVVFVWGSMTMHAGRNRQRDDDQQLAALLIRKE
jgi:hypothetical protein